MNTPQTLPRRKRLLRALVRDSWPRWLKALVCRLTGHQWQVIYTDDDQCSCCRLYRAWPGGEIVAEIRHPPLAARPVSA